MAGKQIPNAGLAFGFTDLQSNLWNQPVEMQASAAVAAATVVAIGTNGQVATAATNGTAALCVGVSQDAIASGNVGNVIIQGVATGVTADGAIAAGALLKRSATTAGAVAATASPAAGEVIGFAIAASAGGVVTVWVTKGT